MAKELEQIHQYLKTQKVNQRNKQTGKISLQLHCQKQEKQRTPLRQVLQKQYRTKDLFKKLRPVHQVNLHQGILIFGIRRHNLI
jgi:hypothetical protein